MLASNRQSLTAGWLLPDWQAPANVNAWVTTRGATLQASPFGGFNTADHVNDDPAHVQQCRAALAAALDFQYPPIWLDQVHGTRVVNATPDTERQPADAVTTTTPGLPIAIHTADCLPLFICNRSGTQIALAHAGWRGLAAGVIENTVHSFTDQPSDLMIWLGPAIGPTEFEVGNDVREIFLSHSTDHISAFQPSPKTPDGKHWLCDIYQIAHQRLARMGITLISGGNHCTVTDERFFSYRRDHVTGRMLSLMWLSPLTPSKLIAESTQTDRAAERSR